ncbi:TraR/DksA C4-type zinc finger protein [Endozoicomonas acroporae]|uniref:TraR/DksA C4-type zinc finger protein n=1 Tax=Endozoicomonas acroporae TaxID=1701104 RepID=UPI0013D06258|nr:TraR/DksA C4-type zinc finger protein [Endozoicomonas acroporae]
MDDIDRATDLAELTTRIAIDNQRNKMLSAKDSAHNCEECGYEIPSERQIAVPGCSLCVACAEVLEARNKQFRQR